jgi:hypothetical protein
LQAAEMTSLTQVKSLNAISNDDMEDYIIDNINDMQKGDRDEFVNLIKQTPGIDMTKIRQKGNGVQIFFNNIPETLVSVLYNFVKRKIDNEHKVS